MTNTNCDADKSRCIVCNVPVGSKLQYKVHIFDNHQDSKMETDLKERFQKLTGKCDICEQEIGESEVYSRHIMLDHDKILDYIPPAVKNHFTTFETFPVPSGNQE